MKNRTWTILTALLVLTLLLVGCTAAESEEPAAAEAETVEDVSADVATLTFTGMVDAETTYSETQLRGMETMDVEDVNSDGETTIRTGVSLNMLLDEVGVSADATTLVLVADDGYEASVDLAEIQACDECIIAFRNNGGFRSTLPGFPSSAQVKGVIEIRAE